MNWDLIAKWWIKGIPYIWINHSQYEWYDCSRVYLILKKYKKLFDENIFKEGESLDCSYIKKYFQIRYMDEDANIPDGKLKINGKDIPGMFKSVRDLYTKLHVCKFIESFIKYVNHPTIIKQLVRYQRNIDWFDNANLGVILHWGIYSVPAYDDITNIKKRKIQNGAEWYYRRLTAPLNNYAPDGSKSTRDYHLKKYGDMKYQEFANMFTAKNFNADDYAEFFKNSGVKYVIITAKHHDGFCMWPNKRVSKKVYPYNSFDIGPKRDILGELSTSLRKRNIKFGVYYSLMEWDYPSSLKKIDYINDIVLKDLNDIFLRYTPDIWWFDGDWTRTFEEWGISSFLEKVRNNGAITNDRLGKNHPKYAGDYQNFRDRYIPLSFTPYKWENVLTIGYSWGYNKNQKEKDYKSAKELLELYNETLTKGGNFLINMGPKEDGSFDEYELKSFKEMCSLIKSK